MSKQDRQGVRTAANLEQKYQFGRKFSDQKQANANQDRTLAQFISYASTSLESLEKNVSTIESGMTASEKDIVQLMKDLEAAKKDIEELTTSTVSKTGDTMSGNLLMGGNLVKNLGEPQEEADAATKGYVDSIPLGLSMTLLWENASPTSTFAPQTIALDLSGYDSVQVEFEESWQAITSRINVGKHGGVDQIGDIYRDVAGYFYVAHRDITVTTTGVSFSDRLYKYANGQGYGVANQALIPFRIYGIKLGGGPAEEETGNLLDNSKMLDGYRIASDGTVGVLASAICCEEYIDISKARGTHLAVYAYHESLGAYRSYYRMAFYDANKVMIKYCESPNISDPTNAFEEIPAGAVYARVSFTIKGDQYTYMVVRGASDMPLGYYD